MLKAKQVFDSIPYEQLPNFVGKPIHLSWASKGCVWILEKIDGYCCHVRTPKTGKKRQVSALDICYTRASQPIVRAKGTCRFHGDSDKYCCGNYEELNV